VVLTINGKAMTSSGQLRNTVATAGVGKQVELEIWRKGERRKVNVVLAAMPDDKSPPSSSAPSVGAKEVGPLGTTLAPLDNAARKALNVPDSVKSGVVVSDVEVNSKAYDAGIRSGDVLLEIAGTNVTTPQQVKDAWQKSSGAVAVLVFRDGRTLYLAAKH